MRVVKSWIADDGKVFDNAEDCIRYEDNLNFTNLNGACGCLDKEWNLVNPLEDLDSFFIVRLDTEEAVKWWIEYNERIGYDTDGITVPGIYIYEEFQWKNIEERIKFFQDLIKKVKGA